MVRANTWNTTAVQKMVSLIVSWNTLNNNVLQRAVSQVRQAMYLSSKT